VRPGWASKCRTPASTFSTGKPVVATQPPNSSFHGPRFWPGTAVWPDSIRFAGSRCWRSVAAPACVLPLRSSGPAHWCPRQNHGAPAGCAGSKFSRTAGGCLQQSENPLSGSGCSGLPGRRPDVIPTKREKTHRGCPWPARKLLTQRLGMVTCPLLVIELLAAFAESTTLAPGLGIPGKDMCGTLPVGIACSFSTSRVICSFGAHPIVRRMSSISKHSAMGRWGRGSNSGDEMQIECSRRCALAWTSNPRQPLLSDLCRCGRFTIRQQKAAPRPRTSW